MIRADLAFPATKLAQFMTNPSEEHIQAADQAIRSSYNTRFYAAQYGGNHSNSSTDLIISSDASFADNLDDRKSTYGHIITLYGGPIS